MKSYINYNKELLDNELEKQFIENIHLYDLKINFNFISRYGNHTIHYMYLDDWKLLYEKIIYTWFNLFQNK